MAYDITRTYHGPYNLTERWQGWQNIIIHVWIPDKYRQIDRDYHWLVHHYLRAMCSPN